MLWLLECCVKACCCMLQTLLRFSQVPEFVDGLQGGGLTYLPFPNHNHPKPCSSFSPSQVPEFVDFKERLQHSHARALAAVLQVRVCQGWSRAEGVGGSKSCSLRCIAARRGVFAELASRAGGTPWRAVFHLI